MIEEKSKNNFSIYLLAIGTSVSLGNLWRFPYIVGENGGGLFIVIYLILCFVLGFPLLVGELLVGERIKKNLMLFYQNRRNLVLVLFLGLFVLSYYSVISGWVLYFLTQFGVRFFHISSGENYGIQALLHNGLVQWMLSSVHLILVVILIKKNAFSLISKWIKFLVPLFFLVFFLLLMQTLSLPSRDEALRFLFYPDFDNFKLSSLGVIIGHVFFTFSIGFGTLLTVGSFFKEEDAIPVIGFRIALFDLIVSLLSLMIVFPIAFLVTNRSLKDPALFFDVLPLFFSQLKGGGLIGLVFFLFFYVSALNMTISVFQSLINHLKVLMPKSKDESLTYALAMTLLVLSGVFALSTNYFYRLRFHNKGLIELFDTSLIQWFLPILVLLLLRKTLTFSAQFDFKDKFQRITDENLPVTFAQWSFFLKNICPYLIALGLALQVIEILF